MGEGKRENVWEEEGKLIIEGAGREELLLVLLARMMKVDFRVLWVLWERYREDLYYFFFIFAGLKVRFPSFRKFYVALKNIERMLLGEDVKGWRYKGMVQDVVEQVKGSGRLELDMRDRSLFRFRGVEDEEE